MAMVKGRRWPLAAAVLLLVLAACTSTAGRPGPGTGTASTSAGSGPAAPGGLRAVGTRSMEFSELNVVLSQTLGRTLFAEPRSAGS